MNRFKAQMEKAAVRCRGRPNLCTAHKQGLKSAHRSAVGNQHHVCFNEPIKPILYERSHVRDEISDALASRQAGPPIGLSTLRKISEISFYCVRLRRLRVIAPVALTEPPVLLKSEPHAESLCSLKGAKVGRNVADRGCVVKFAPNPRARRPRLLTTLIRQSPTRLVTILFELQPKRLNVALMGEQRRVVADRLSMAHDDDVQHWRNARRCGTCCK